MQAGRELDVLIAEKVMGVKEKWLCYDGVPVAPCLIDLDKYDPEECTYIEEHGTNKGCKEYKKSRNIKHYSTDIAAAWEVEQVVGEMGDRAKHDYVKNLAQDSAIKDREVNYFSTWFLVHATPEQRCKAALKTLEVNA